MRPYLVDQLHPPITLDDKEALREPWLSIPALATALDAALAAAFCTEQEGGHQHLDIMGISKRRIRTARLGQWPIPNGSHRACVPNYLRDVGGLAFERTVERKERKLARSRWRDEEGGQGWLELTFCGQGSRCPPYPHVTDGLPQNSLQPKKTLVCITSTMERPTHELTTPL